MTTTNHIPSLELLQSTHKFPGKYTFKVIGDSQTLIPADLMADIQKALGLAEPPKYEHRHSAGGKHIAITVEMQVPSAEAVHTVYHRLLANPGVRLVL